MPPSGRELGTANLQFLEEMYSAYVKNAGEVPADWCEYFDGFKAQGAMRLPVFRPIQPGLDLPCAAQLQAKVDQLIRNYRVRGHIIAKLDPLGKTSHMPPELRPEYYGLDEKREDLLFHAPWMPADKGLPLRAILARLQDTYCRFIGAQFMHIDDLAVREWLQSRMERTGNRLELDRAEQLRILTRLTDAAIFEEFLQRKYIGAKSFSLEGAESLIPLLDLAIERAGDKGIAKIIIGMGHRGRLNVLANIMGKHPWQIFREFDDSIERLDGGRGDVKYHLGFHNEWKTAAGNEVYLALCFNPSHLEFVNPEALGRMRAHMDRVGDTKHERGLVLLIHGDASFAGEGIVQESLNLSRLPAYTVGGAIHVIINNQIGFTTGPEQSRSSIYASDVAKLLQSPIFHVNGEDPEAVAQVLNLALDFRGAFAQDVVIDMYCFRKHGHNEGDEPAFTQPLLYEAIRRRASVREEYLARLSESGGLTREEGEEIARRRRENLEAELRVAREPIPSGLPAAREGEKEPAPRPGGLWTGYEGGLEAGVAETPTTFDKGRLAEFLAGLAQLPEDFHLHPKLLRGLEQRRRMAREEIPVDWAAAEALAFATLASENRSVRLTGQDSERGTFSHRHAVLHDIKDGHTYTPLQHVTSGQAQIEISNSPLSEAAVLGFEYGYSVQAPDGLVIWEAQFGDFCNAAQVMVDQFIASGEEKWRRLSSLTLLLPHGFEGQGPEHSSARLERFLQLAAEDNIQVVFPTTPAQFFHLLRRQVWRSWRKPLIVLTPKSLLRHPQVVSPLKELAQGRFHPVLPDEAGVEAGSANGKKPASQSPPPFPAFRDPHAIKRILLCSGKIYYELLRQRQELGQADAALIRLEQLYPFPEMELAKVLEPYPDGTPAFWVQEEPENMGAWNYLREKVGPRLLGRMPLSHVARPASASPSTGSHTQHKREQTALLQRAFIGTAVEETMAHAH